MKEIILTTGGVTFVDDIDYLEFMPYNCSQNAWGYVRRTFRCNKKLVTVYLHREILKRMGCEEFPLCDHKNRNTLDNQRDNLRPATKSQNCCNKKLQSNNTSGYRNVIWDTRKSRWVATLRVNGVRIYIGSYIKKEEAIINCQIMAKFYFGEFTNSDL